MDWLQLKDSAVEAALSAGKIIQQRMNDDILVEEKEGAPSHASAVVTEVDRACEAVILSHLQPACDAYDIALLSEEAEDDGSRLIKDFFWCIDPMDGTLPFIHKRPGFSVSIALVAKDGTPYIGVVYDPSTDTLFYAVKGFGAFKNNHPWEIRPANSYLTYVTDRKLEDTPRSAEIKQLLKQKEKQLQLNGIKEIAGSGAVLNGILVLENGPACMVKLPKKENGGGSLWDYAATACIFQELGMAATNFKGGRLDLNREENTFMNHQGIFYANFLKSSLKK
jgi:fructose-1,6-bisphosphatase/inositol monophosphatase family enzyme